MANIDLETLKGLVEEPKDPVLNGLAIYIEANTIPPGFNNTRSELTENLMGIRSYLSELVMNGLRFPATQLHPEFANHYLNSVKPSFQECLTPTGQEVLHKVENNVFYTGACAAALGMAYVGFKSDFSGSLF